VFQSLNRAYKRSDAIHGDAVASKAVVSIPQSGLQAFRQALRKGFHGLARLFQSLNRAYKRSDGPPDALATPTEVFQSLNRAYKRSDALYHFKHNMLFSVSIPQSGLQAFRLIVQ